MNELTYSCMVLLHFRHFQRRVDSLYGVPGIDLLTTHVLLFLRYLIIMHKLFDTSMFFNHETPVSYQTYPKPSVCAPQSGTTVFEQDAVNTFVAHSSQSTSTDHEVS